jgi:hypothetical protein
VPVQYRIPVVGHELADKVHYCRRVAANPESARNHTTLMMLAKPVTAPARMAAAGVAPTRVTAAEALRSVTTATAAKWVESSSVRWLTGIAGEALAAIPRGCPLGKVVGLETFRPAKGLLRTTIRSSRPAPVKTRAIARTIGGAAWRLRHPVSLCLRIGLRSVNRGLHAVKHLLLRGPPIPLGCARKCLSGA